MAGVRQCGGCLNEQCRFTDAGVAANQQHRAADKAAAGDAVSTGQTVIVLESMKMELHVSAPFDGAVASIRCVVGDMVERHQHLGEVAPIAASAE